MTIYESSFVKYLLKSFDKKSIAYFFIFIFCQDFFINFEYMYFKKFFICECAHTAVCVCVCVCRTYLYSCVVCRISLYSLKTFLKFYLCICMHIYLHDVMYMRSEDNIQESFLSFHCGLGGLKTGH